MHARQQQNLHIVTPTLQNQKTDSSTCLDILELALAPLDLPFDLDDAEDFKLTDKESERRVG